MTGETERDETWLRERMHRAGRTTGNDTAAWPQVSATVSRRRTRRRRVASLGAAGLSLVALTTGAVLSDVPGLGTVPWAVAGGGPEDLPPYTATTTLRPADPTFDYFAAATTFADLDAAGPDQATVDLLGAAEATLVADCMADAGYDWRPRQVAPGETPDDRMRIAYDQQRATAFGNLGYSRQNGYGIDLDEWTRVVVQNEGSPPDEHRQSDSVEDDPEGAMLAYEGPGTGTTIDLGWLGTTYVSTEGCQARARTQLYGDLTQWVRSDAKYRSRANPYVLDPHYYDRELRELDGTWARCMAEKGFPGLSSQPEAWSLAWTNHEDHPDEADALEVQVATADAECVVGTGYDTAYAVAEERVVRHLVGDPDLTAYGALVEQAVPVARAITS